MHVVDDPATVIQRRSRTGIPGSACCLGARQCYASMRSPLNVPVPEAISAPVGSKAANW